MLRLGLDIGGTKINIGLLDGEGRRLGVKKLLVKDIVDPCADIRAATEALCLERGVSFGAIAACGVGVPGTVSEDGKRLLKVPNINLLSEDFATRLEGKLGIPVTMVQDSRAAALGEYLVGAGRGARTLVCITLGTGVGTGIVIDGRIYNGALGAAGELGHVPVVEGGRPCGCGRLGCMEKYSAGRGLDISAAELLGEGSCAPDLFAAAKEGNEDARRIIGEAVRYLGAAVVAAVNLLSPDCVLFSGGLSQRREEYLEPVIDYIKSHCYTSGRLPRIESAALGEYAPLVGAALAAGARL